MNVQFALIMWTTIGFALLGVMWMWAVISLINMQKQIDYLYSLLEEVEYETPTQLEQEYS